MIKHLLDWLHERAFPIFCVSLILVLIGGVVYLAHRDAVWWKAYKVAYHCKPTEKTRTQVVIQWIYGSNGQITGSFPIFVPERLWACDTLDVWRPE